MRLQFLVYSVWLLPAFALTGFNDPQTNYDPLCAHACQRALGTNMLECSDMMNMNHDMMAISSMTFPACFASDTPYLTSMAYCISIKCTEEHAATSKIDNFWERKITGDPNTPAKWTYAEALKQVTEPPTRVLGSTETLAFTALANESVYFLQAITLDSVYREGVIESKYSIAIAVAGFAIPIVVTLLGYLPYMTSLFDKLKPYIVYPSVFRSYQVRPLPYLLGNAPTVGQSIYIGVMVVLNIIFTAIAYKPVLPHAWYPTIYLEVLAYVMWRTGCIGFALLPLVILFSGRNNVLLWLTNWSHSTYLLLHRWIARVFGIQVILHSITALILYVKNGSFASNEKMAWWIWGVIATLTTVIMLVASGLYVRRRSYELFLITHIILAVFTIAGCWYHVLYRFDLVFGYQQWLYAAIGIWIFDRVLRVLRILKTGVRRARITELGDEGGYVRIDVEGVRWDAEAGKHVYVYFPTLNPLRPWENHPFSLLPTSMLSSYHHSLGIEDGDSAEGSSKQGDPEKNATSTMQRATILVNSTAGITFFVKKSTGMTKLLRKHDNILTLLDGPYQNNSTKSALQCDRLLLIGGGIGISGLLPWLNMHPNAKLCWSMKKSAECLATQGLDVVLSGVAESDVKVGQRLDIEELLSEEVGRGWEKIGVVVCGPGGLCDDVRAAVGEFGRRGRTIFELEVDAYSW